MLIPLAPARILDTRSGVGGSMVGPVRSLSLLVAGRGGIPSGGVASVVLNVTAVTPSRAGYLTVWSDLTSRPGTSNLNFAAAQTVSNQVITQLGPNGRVELFNGSAGTVQLVVDVSGYYPAGRPVLPGAFVPLPPARVADTRSGLGGQKVLAGSYLDVGMQFGSAVPIEAHQSAVMLNVTVTEPTGSGYLTAWDATTPQPPTSNLNFPASRTVSHLMLVPVGYESSVRFYNGSNGSIQLIVDIVGYVVTGTAGVSGGLALVRPSRILDTRSNLGGAVVEPRGTLDLRVAGASGVPAAGVSAVLMNVTAVTPTAAGFLTVWPSTAIRPTVSSINFDSATTISNQVVVPVGADGRVTFYNGSNGSVQLVVDLSGYFVEALPPVSGIAGTVQAWGYDGFGALGDGDSFVPAGTVTTVSDLTSVVSVAGGGLSEYALESDGTVWAWGPNSGGELGDGTTISRTSPVRIPSLAGVVSIAGGNYTAYAVKSDGTVWAWGENLLGQLGDGGSELTSSIPVRVAGVTGAVAVAAGSAGTAYALKSDGTVWAWGYNYFGAVGDGTNTDRHTPVRVGSLTGVRAIAGGGNSGYALMNDGTVQAWGENGSGQLGNGTAPQDTEWPAPVHELTDVTAVAADGDTVYALTADGTVHAWGANEVGELGNGTSDTISTLPVTVSGLSGVTSVAAGFSFGLARLDDGTVWAWGIAGELGQGNSANLSVPGPVQGLKSAIAVAANTQSAYAILG